MKKNKMFSAKMFIISILCLLLSLSYFISVSYADWTSSPINSTVALTNKYTTTPATFGDYTMATIKQLVKNYIGDSTTYETQYNSMIEYLENMDLALVFVKSGNQSYCLVFPNNIDVGLYNNNRYYFVNSGRVNFGTSAFGTYYYGDSTDTTAVYYDILQSPSLLYSTKSVKHISYANGYYWNGEYDYEVTPPQPSYIPTNEEIATKVQDFYNNVFSNQSDFKAFYVLYNYQNETFSFIGHNLIGKVVSSIPNFPEDEEVSLLSQYVYTSDYPLNSYNIPYWNFHIETLVGEIQSFFGNKYWLYSTTLSSDTFSNDGIGKISDLLELKFNSDYSTIVYSNYGYTVRLFDSDSDISGDNPVPSSQAYMTGDLYTYDENVVPSESGYNPISNFVPVNPVDTALGRIDTANLILILNDNILSFTEMAWVFTAVSSLFTIFSSLLVIVCILLLISKIIGG